MKKGFTLVELMVVVVIIGILASLAIPRFMIVAAKSRASEFRLILKQMYDLEAAYQTENDTYSNSTSDIGMDGISPKSRFSYSMAAGQTTFVGTAALRTNSIYTFAGEATIDQSGSGAVSGTLAQAISWSGLGR